MKLEIKENIEIIMFKLCEYKLLLLLLTLNKNFKRLIFLLNREKEIKYSNQSIEPLMQTILQ